MVIRSRKSKERQNMVHKTLHIKLKLWNTNRGELGSFGMVRSSCSTCGTHRVGVKQQSLTHSNGNGLIL
jgi:hypothetical protein